MFAVTAVSAIIALSNEGERQLAAGIVAIGALLGVTYILLKTGGMDQYLDMANQEAESRKV